MAGRAVVIDGRCARDFEPVRDAFAANFAERGDTGAALCVTVGKELITVRQLLSHEAGLPAVRRRLPRGAMLDWELMTAELAAHPPWWEPGSAHGYHVNTFGYLIGEVIRRRCGRSVGAVLREEVAGPLGADVHIGLPASEHGRAAEFAWPGPQVSDEGLAGFDDDPADLSGAGVVNSPAWRAAEVPSANAHATALGALIDALYQCL